VKDSKKKSVSTRIARHASGRERNLYRERGHKHAHERDRSEI